MSNASSDLLYPAWQPRYEDALLELDHTKLPERIAVARKAITERLNELAQDHFGPPEERQAISDALNGLASLERELETPPITRMAATPRSQSRATWKSAGKCGYHSE